MSDGYISPNGPSVLASDLENPVALSSPRQKWLDELRQLPRDLMGGTAAMRAAGRKYLPQHPAESDGAYNLRINATVLYGAFSQTVVRQAGKLFMKPVTITDASPVVNEFAADVDGQGRSLTSFMNEAACEAFVDGMSIILVDYPTVQEGSTQADVMLMGARPYWVMIRAGAVLGVRSINAGGRQLLTQLRFKEVVEEQVGEFETMMVEQVRVLDLGGAFRIYRKVSNGKGGEDWAIYREGQASWIEIPAVAVYTNRCGFFEGLPPLRELAELNQEHWVSSSEQRRALSFGRFGMLKIIGRPPTKGAGKKEVEIAPDTVIDVPLGGDAGYVESTGAGITAGALDIKAIEDRMRTTGMQVNVEAAGQVTATASAIDSAEGNAALKAVAKSIEVAINEALLITGQFISVPQVGVAHVYDEFAEESHGGTNEMLALYGAGLLSKRTTWDELVRRHVLDDDFDPDQEEVRINEEMGSLQSMSFADARQAAGGAALPPDAGTLDQAATAPAKGGRKK